MSWQMFVDNWWLILVAIILGCVIIAVIICVIVKAMNPGVEEHHDEEQYRGHMNYVGAQPHLNFQGIASSTTIGGPVIARNLNENTGAIHERMQETTGARIMPGTFRENVKKLTSDVKAGKVFKGIADNAPNSPPSIKTMPFDVRIGRTKRTNPAVLHPPEKKNDEIKSIYISEPTNVSDIIEEMGY